MLDDRPSLHSHKSTNTHTQGGGGLKPNAKAMHRVSLSLSSLHGRAGVLHIAALTLRCPSKPLIPSPWLGPPHCPSSSVFAMRAPHVACRIRTVQGSHSLAPRVARGRGVHASALAHKRCACWKRPPNHQESQPKVGLKTAEETRAAIYNPWSLVNGNGRASSQ